jgi:hypothetical protein
LVDGVLDGFDADTRAVREGGRKGRAISDSRDVRVACQEFLIDQDAIPDRKLRLDRRIDVRDNTNPHENEIPRNMLGRCRLDPGRASALARDPRRKRPESETDALCLVRRAEEGGHGGRKRARHRPLRGLDDGHGDAALHGKRGEFEPDEAGAHDHGAADVGEAPLQVGGVGQGAKLDHAVEIGPGTGRARFRDPVASTRWS